MDSKDIYMIPYAALRSRDKGERRSPGQAEACPTEQERRDESRRGRHECPRHVRKLYQPGARTSDGTNVKGAGVFAELVHSGSDSFRLIDINVHRLVFLIDANTVDAALPQVLARQGALQLFGFLAHT